jgi:hypothetical protein
MVRGSQANERMNLAVMGTMYVAGHFFSSVHAHPDVNIVALCNPDQRKVPDIIRGWEEQARKLSGSKRPEDIRAAGQYRSLAANRPPVYADFRRMLEEMDDRIDGVVVSMFDHYHGVACGAAMRAGRHVFSERPLGLSIGDARALRQLAAQQKVATSIRNPGNASGQFRRGVELVREGAIGEVREVHVWFNRGGPDLQRPPQGAAAIPDGVDWDLWLGPAADRPYHPEWMSYALWRDFSNGGIGTFGPHAANLPFMALNVHELWQPAPPGTAARTIRIRAECSRINQISFPRWERIRWQVPARGPLPPVVFTWHNHPTPADPTRELIVGRLRQAGASEEEGVKLMGYAGALLVGARGLMASDDHNVKVTVLPAERFEGVDRDRPRSLPASRGHYNDWFIACRGGEPAMANFGYAGPLSEFIMLGNLATRFDDELEYDPVAGRIINNARADQALSYEYRPGWRI